MNPSQINQKIILFDSQGYFHFLIFAKLFPCRTISIQHLEIRPIGDIIEHQHESILFILVDWSTKKSAWWWKERV